GENYPRTTDKFGSFNYEYSPIGNCRVFANFNDGAGFLDVIVGHGQISQIEVKLDKSIINYKRKISLWPLIVFILIAGASIFLITNKKEAKFEKNKIETKPHLSQPGNRTNDIMRTLDFKEQNVVKYLMEKNCRITQNEISREVGIPKTSLIRVIENLEKKHIIDVEKIGKFKKLELTN
ncbi:winged helix-turn-helix transcriptional regulator, partial [archaeon]|nr:winged helix-turn-helix transcriptional regulator [archaeon]